MLIKKKNRLQWFFINLKYALRINKPLLVCRLIKNYLSIFLFKKKLLRYVDFSIGYKCNLNCKHCFAVSLVEKDRHMITPLEYGRIAQEAIKMGAVNFSFQGGEPLLYPELGDYIRAAKPYSNLISVTTNGTLLTDTTIRKLKDWGVDILTVSLDSGIPQEHDDFRQKQGCFLQIYSGIKKALSCKLNVTIGTVINHYNLKGEGIKRLIDLSSNLKLILMLIPAIPIGRWEGNEDVLLRGDDFTYLEQIVSKYPYVRTDFDANYFKKGCGAVKEILYINPYGDVFACPFIHKKLGNVCSEPLYAIRQRALKHRLFQDYNDTCIATTKNNLNE